jgi:hypothetical protein
MHVHGRGHVGFDNLPDRSFLPDYLGRQGILQFLDFGRQFSYVQLQIFSHGASRLFQISKRPIENIKPTETSVNDGPQNIVVCGVTESSGSELS